MAMPIRADDVTTIEELLALPDDGLRHELLDGVHVVTPAPALPHQAVLLRFIRALDHALLGCDLLALLPSPADIRLGPRTLVQPDLFVFRKESGRRVREWSEVGVPVLAIEFLSPSTAARDRGAKRRIYQRGRRGRVLDRGPRRAPHPPSSPKPSGRSREHSRQPSEGHARIADG